MQGHVVVPVLAGRADSFFRPPVLGMINNCVILGEHCRESTEASKAIKVLTGTSSSNS